MHCVVLSCITPECALAHVLCWPCAGVDFAIKRMVVGDNNIKLTIWDTAGADVA
jgi:hypothetical protein